MNRVRYMLGMICMLLAYGFDFRTQAVFTCTAGSVITIQVKQYAPTRKTSLRGEYNWDWSGISSCGDFKGLTWFTRNPLFLKTRQMEAFLAGWFYANMWGILYEWISGQVNSSIRHRVYMYLSILKLTQYSWLLVMLSRTALWDCVGGQVLIHFPTQSLNRWWKKR